MMFEKIIFQNTKVFFFKQSFCITSKKTNNQQKPLMMKMRERKRPKMVIYQANHTHTHAVHMHQHSYLFNDISSDNQGLRNKKQNKGKNKKRKAKEENCTVYMWALSSTTVCGWRCRIRREMVITRWSLICKCTWWTIR